ncbi:MAG TPA: nuclear transport factor 2 family protein [Acidimicrobiales bacterium]|nr:nuclear transport factor 2 family protein [Acidimicrobiales bacterium]
MTTDEMDALIDRHFRAEERCDEEAAIADLADDVELEVAGVHRSRGKAAAKAFYIELFATYPLKRIVSERRNYGEDFAVDEAFVEATDEQGWPALFRVLHVFDFRDGLIARECSWRSAESAWRSAWKESAARQR